LTYFLWAQSVHGFSGRRLRLRLVFDSQSLLRHVTIFLLMFSRLSGLLSYACARVCAYARAYLYNTKDSENVHLLVTTTTTTMAGGQASAATPAQQPKLKVCALHNDERRVHASNVKLAFAAHAERIDVVQEVLDRGTCDVDNARPKDGATPLYFACQAGHALIAETLLQNGARIDLATNDDGTTPLYVACEQNKTDVVIRLIRHGADPNKAKTSDGATPLHTACFQNNAFHVCLLVLAGARKKQTAMNGMMPQDVANTKAHFALPPLLVLPVRWRPSFHSRYPKRFRMRACALFVSLRAAGDGIVTLLCQLLGSIEWEETALRALKAAGDTEPERIWDTFRPPALEVLDFVRANPKANKRKI
jgi:hypothetical protein